MCVWKTVFWLCVRTSRVKSGKLSLINRCVPSICFTDSPSFSGSCCKTVSHKKKSPANTFSETHAYDMQVEIFDHEGGTITHTWKHTLDLAHQLHKTCSSPTALKVEPHKAAHLEALLQEAAVSSSCTVLIILNPYYESHLTVSVIIPHMLMQQSSSQAKWQTDQSYKLRPISYFNGLNSHNVCH